MLDPANETCKYLMGRLYNSKFGSAWGYALQAQEEGVISEEDFAVVEALGRMLDNPGWFGEDLNTICWAAIASIVPPEVIEEWDNG